jgi:hypothetical protein
VKVLIVGSIRQVGIVDTGGQHVVLGGLNYGGIINLSTFNMMYRQVSGGNSESHGIRNIVDSLEETISINIAVATTGNSVS